MHSHLLPSHADPRGADPRRRLPRVDEHSARQGLLGGSLSHVQANLAPGWHQIVALSALIDAFPFPDSPFSSATLAVDDPDRPEGPSRKRRRLESGGDEGWDTPGRVEGARAARLAFELVETELEDLAALAQAVKLSLALRRTPVDQNKVNYSWGLGV